MGGCGKVALSNLKSKNPTWLETSKSANFSFYRVGVGGKGALCNLKCKNPTWLETSKSANFSFDRGEVGWEGVVKELFEIWSPKIQLDLKLPNLPTFHFTGWRVGGSSTFKSEVQKSKLIWIFQICQLFILQGGGLGDVALSNLKYKNPTWLETSKSANFSFYRLGLGRSGTLKYEGQESNFQICQIFT